MPRRNKPNAPKLPPLRTSLPDSLLSETELDEIAAQAAALWLDIGEAIPGPNVYRAIHKAIKQAYANGKTNQ